MPGKPGNRCMSFIWFRSRFRHLARLFLNQTWKQKLVKSYSRENKLRKWRKGDKIAREDKNRNNFNETAPLNERKVAPIFCAKLLFISLIRWWARDQIAYAFAIRTKKRKGRILCCVSVFWLIPYFRLLTYQWVHIGLARHFVQYTKSQLSATMHNFRILFSKRKNVKQSTLILLIFAIDPGENGQTNKQNMPRLLHLRHFLIQILTSKFVHGLVGHGWDVTYGLVESKKNLLKNIFFSILIWTFTYSNAGFGKVRPHSNFFPSAHVWISISEEEI